MKLPLFAALGGLLLLSTAIRAESTDAHPCHRAGPLTIYVVRHAERAEDGTDDPGLSEAGHARAHALAEALAQAHVDQVYTTQLRRTRDTALPLLRQKALEEHTWPVMRGQAEAHVTGLAAELCTRHVDESLLVVGHSNTVPQLVGALSRRTQPEISEREYDHFYKVRLDPERKAEVLELRFGAPNRPPFKVAWKGTLRSFHHGDVSGRVDLDRFQGRPHLVAIGPAAGLDGEISALDGQWFITRVREGEPVTTKIPSGQAGFLVWAEVTEWQPPSSTNRHLGSQQALEAVIAELAEQAGMDSSLPFPVLIEGRVKSLDYHVLAPAPGDQQDAGHLDAAFKDRLENVELALFGFYSRHHGGIFTHRGSHLHLHALLPGGHAAHVDALQLEPGARVRFPR